MNINKINNSNYLNTTISSKAYPNHFTLNPLSPLKNIPENRCACCGNEMITSDVFRNIWTKITLPITKVFSGSCFESIKAEHPKIYKVLNFFYEAYPNKSFDNIMLDDSNHAMFIDSVRNTVMEENGTFLTSVAYRKTVKKKTMEIFNAFERKLKQSSDIVRELKPFEKYMHNEKIEVFNELESLSSIYPEKTLSEMVQIPEVAEEHIIGAYNDAIDFAKKRDYHWEKADNLILAENKNLKTPLEQLHAAVSEFYIDDNDPKRCSYMIQKLYKNFLKENNLENIEQSVLEEISQLPVRGYTKNLFMSAAARNKFSDGAIVRYLIKPAMESEKRLIHVEDGGNNDITNKLVYCRDCCDKLHRLPFDEIRMYHPEIIQNSKKQIKLIEDRITSGVIDFKFRNYPVDIAKTLYKYTNGAIVPDLKEYIEKIKEMEDYEKFLEES